jgi:hypothetical protein
MAWATDVRVLPRKRSFIHASATGMMQTTEPHARYMAAYCMPKLSSALPHPSSAKPTQPVAPGIITLRWRRA